MELEVGSRVKRESESVARPARTGVIEKVVPEAPSPRYRFAGTTGTRASTRRRQGRCILPSRSDQPDTRGFSTRSPWRTKS
jgi:hypothetical protein